MAENNKGRGTTGNDNKSGRNPNQDKGSRTNTSSTKNNPARRTSPEEDSKENSRKTGSNTPSHGDRSRMGKDENE